MIWLALASIISPPVPADARAPGVLSIFRVGDFPTYLQMAGVSRIVYVRTTVRPDGTIQGCVTEASSGDTNLDAYTCGLIVRRARLLPATWTDGSPVYGVIRVPVTWLVANYPLSDDERLRLIVPDLALAVNRLPEGAPRIVAVNLAIAADEKGQPVTCIENSAPGFTPKRHFPELVPIACQQVTARWKAVPPTDPAGKAVRSIQTVSVNFQINR